MSYAKGSTTKSFNFPCTDCSIKRENSAATSQERELNNSLELHALLFKPTCTGYDRATSGYQLKTLKVRYFTRKCQCHKMVHENRRLFLDYCHKS